MNNLDFDSHCIQGFLPLLEFPFLQLSESGYSQLLSDMNFLLEQTKTYHPLSWRAILLLEKLIRSDRLNAFQARLYRSHDPLAKTLISLIDEAGKKAIEDSRRTPLIAPTIREEPLMEHSENNTEESLITELLMSIDEFTLHYMDDGSLYHGSPQLHSLIKTRSSLFLQDSSQAANEARREVITIKSYEPQCTFGGDEGSCILNLGIKNDSRIRIFDFDRNINHPNFKIILAEAQKNKLGIKEYLSLKYKIDIIINEGVTVLNASALQVPKNLTNTMNIYFDKIQRERLISQVNSNFFSVKHFDDILQYLELSDLARASRQLGPERIPSEAAAYITRIFGLNYPSISKGIAATVIRKILFDRLLHSKNPKLNAIGLGRTQYYSRGTL